MPLNEDTLRHVAQLASATEKPSPEAEADLERRIREASEAIAQFLGKLPPGAKPR